MKITFVVPHLKIAGGIRIILGYAKHLSKNGNIVNLLVRETSTTKNIVYSFAPFLRPQWGELASGVTVQYFKKLSRNHFQETDYVIAGTHDLALEMHTLIPHTTKKWYLVQHDEGLYHGDRSSVNDALNLSQRNIVVSTWLQNVVKKVTEKEAPILLNPLDKKLFFKEGKKENDGNVRVLLLDHSYRWKGTEEGLRTLRKLKEDHSNVIVMGFGVRGSKRKGEYDEFYFNVPQQKLRLLYSRADIFLCPSWDEGFGLPSLEALACGTPVVTYDNGGSRDFALHGTTALVAPRKNVEALKAHLKTLIIDEALRTKLGEGGSQLIKSWPSWDEQTNRLERILQEL